MLLLLAPRPCSRSVEVLWEALERLAFHRWPSYVVVSLLGLLGNGATHLLLGPPVPTITDEASYLFGAQTFAAGRLANPSPPLPETIRSDHVLDRPTWQSKYPPAQALLLTPGVAAGRPELSLAFSASLLGAAALFALRAWLPPVWALAGALLVVARLGVGSYWNQSYWGGTAAALGGCLLLGAVGRWRRPPVRPLLAMPTVVGLALLANSRPFEGLLFSLPLVVVLSLAVWRQAGGVDRRQALFAASLALAGLVAAALATARYHVAVTGSWDQLPHSLYRVERLDGIGHFLSSHPRTRDQPVSSALTLGPLRLAVGLRFLVGLLLAPLAFVGALAVRSVRIPALAGATVFAGHFFTGSWHVHYVAPATAAVVLLAVAGAERLRGLRFRGVSVGRWIVVAALATSGVVALFELPAHRADEGSPALVRADLEAELTQSPGRDLVLVDAGIEPGLWVVNHPRLDQAEVVWARDLDPERTRRLRELYSERRVWALEPGPPTRLRPLDPPELQRGRAATGPRDAGALSPAPVR